MKCREAKPNRSGDVPWKKHPFNEPGPLEARLGATAPSGRFEHAERRRNRSRQYGFHQYGFRHAELARRRPIASSSLVGRNLTAKAGTGPTYEVTIGPHRPRFKRVWTFPSAHDHPRGRIRQRSTQPQTTLAGSSKRPKRCIVRMFENCSCVKSRRKLLQRSTITHHDVLERIPSPNTAAQHGPIRKCQKRAQFAPRCAPKIRSAASSGRRCWCPKKPPAPCRPTTLKSQILWPLRRVRAVVVLVGLPNGMWPGRGDGQADSKR